MTDRTPIFFDTAEIQNIEAVQEMARVGIIVSREKAPVGHRFDMAGQRFVVTGHATREEFLEAVRRAAVESSRGV